MPTMDAEIITLGEAVMFFSEDVNVIKKGELKFKSNFVLDLKIEGYVIAAKVRASMKDKSYSVKIKVDGFGGIEAAECECPRGNWVCSHMAAVAIYVNKKGMSKTDLPNSWITHPKKADKENIRPMSEVFPTLKPTYSALSRRPDKADKRFLSEKLLQAKSDCPLAWIVGPEPHLHSQTVPAVVIADILPDFMNNKDIFLQKCKVTSTQIHQVAYQTKLQLASQLWGKLRRLRLTGSNFGMVLGAYHRNTAEGKPYPLSLFKSLRGEYDFSGKDSIMWGQMHERVAVQAYQSTTGNTVHQIGLILFECGFLGCSPDGLISVDQGSSFGVLEVKCPWKHRNKTVDEMITEELKGRETLSSFFLTSQGELNPNHNYWHQVQAEIAAANVEWGHFVIWTTKEMKVLLVRKEASWAANNLPKLKSFYLEEFLPKVCC